MGKSFVVLAATMAVFILFFSVVLATNFHTTITTVEIDDENPSQSCQQQIEKQQEQLKVCQHYLKDSSQSIPDQMMNQGRGWREDFPICCEQLEQINEQCRCEAVKQVVQQQQQRGELQGREMREMLQTAQSLPGLCRMRPQRCDIRGGSGRGGGGGSWF